MSGRPMDRRGFLESTLATGVAASLGPSLRRFSPTRMAAGFELEEASLADLQAGMKAGKYSARGLAELYLARIEAWDDKTRAVIEINIGSFRLH